MLWAVCHYKQMATHPLYGAFLYEMPELCVRHFLQPIYSPRGLRQATSDGCMHRDSVGIRNP